LAFSSTRCRKTDDNSSPEIRSGGDVHTFNTHSSNAIYSETAFHRQMRISKGEVDVNGLWLLIRNRKTARRRVVPGQSSAKLTEENQFVGAQRRQTMHGIKFWCLTNSRVIPICSLDKAGRRWLSIYVYIQLKDK